MNMGDRIRELRLQKGLTQEELGNYIGVKKSAIRKYEKGSITNLKKNSIEILANLFNVTPSYLMCMDSNDELNNAVISIPLLGTVKAGYNYLAQENIIGYENIDNVSNKDDYYALRVTGDSMEPLFSDGDVAIVHKQDDFESGNTCIILINGDEATVKKVVKVEDGIDLIAMNPYYPKQHFSSTDIRQKPVKIIGKVVEARKRNQFK